MSKNLNIGILGAGRIGSFHAKSVTLHTDAKVLGVADTNTDAAKALASQVGAKKVYSSCVDLTKDKSIDAVIISLPNNLHYKAAIASIEASKHVFCEKPLSINLEDAEDIVRKVQKSDVKFQVGYNRRFDFSYEKAKKMIDDGYLGKILIAHSDTFDPEPHKGWEADESLSGGILFTTCSHDFDMLYWLVGSEVNRVYVDSKGEFGKNQNVICFLSFKNDALATVRTIETCPYGHDVKTEIVGEKAAVRIEKPSATFIRTMDRAGVHNDYPYWFTQRFEDSYIREIQDFVGCIIEGTEPRVTAKDGMHAVKVAQAASESEKRGMPVNA